MPPDLLPACGAHIESRIASSEAEQTARVVLFVLGDSLLSHALFAMAGGLAHVRDDAPLRPICLRHDEIDGKEPGVEPSVVVVDISGSAEPDLLIDRIKTDMPRVPIVLVVPDHRFADERVLALVDAGRVEALVDSATSEPLWIGILRVVLAGGRYVPARAKRALREPATESGAARDAFENASAGPSASGGPSMSGLLEALSPREREVIGLLADGLQNKTIAYRLGLSTHTVKVHLQNAYRKLNTHNRTQAAALMHRVRDGTARLS